MNRFLIMAFIVGLMFTGCESNDSDRNFSDDYLLLGTYYNQGVKVEVYAEDSLAVGYNPIYVALYDSTDNRPIEEGHVLLTPVMHMMGMTHSAPVENPDDVSAVGGLFPCAAVFQMPGNAMEYWELVVDFHEHHEGRSGEISLQVPVKNSERCRVLTGADTAKYIVTWMAPVQTDVGMNDITFTVHKMESMMSFVPVTDVTFEMTPSMPSMGHGSPNNMNPSHTQKGHYSGQLNCTMSGDWRIDLVIKRNDVSLLTTYFDIVI